MKSEESKNCSKTLIILIIVCITLSIITLGIVVYDNFIRSDTILKPISGSNEENKETNNNDISYVKELKDIAITDVNKSVKLGNRDFKVKTGSKDNQDYVLFINDKVVSKDNKFIHADKAYVTDKYILFTSAGQNGQLIVYAIDSEGKEISVKNDNQYQMNNFKIVSNILHAQGDKFCFDDCGPEHDIMILYIGNSLVVAFAD